MFCTQCGNQLNANGECERCTGVASGGNQVRVVISRRSAFVGCAVSYKVFVDGREVAKLGNVSILDGTVEEYEGIIFGGTMAFNDWTWAFHLEPEPDGNIHKFLFNWHYWFDYVNWNYMNNNHSAILKSEMQKLDKVVSQKPDIIMTHYIPLFFGVERQYYYSDSTTYFYFNGQKYLDKLKDQSIWLAGHTHTVRAKDLLQGDGRIIQLKLNPVGYPDEDSGNAAAMDKFLVEK